MLATKHCSREKRYPQNKMTKSIKLTPYFILLLEKS